MKRDINRYGEWALVAGAAEGIGEAFTLHLLARGMKVVLVDRNEEALRHLISRHNLQQGSYRSLHLDLADQDAANRCLEATHDIDCRLLIYVAAFSPVHPFSRNTPGDLDRHLNVNARTVIHLIHGFTSRLKQKEGGGVILISSLAGLIGPPLVAPYAATKGFLILLAESLHHELKPDGIDVTACCAGVTDTPMFRLSHPRFGVFKPQIQQPEEVAVYAIKMIGRRAICISGGWNRLFFFILIRIFPRRFSGWIMKRNMFALYHTA